MGRTDFLGVSQVCVFTEASLEKKSKLMLKSGDSGKLPTEAAAAAAGDVEAGSSMARKLKQPCGGSCC